VLVEERTRFWPLPINGIMKLLVESAAAVQRQLLGVACCMSWRKQLVWQFRACRLHCGGFQQAQHWT